MGCEEHGKAAYVFTCIVLMVCIVALSGCGSSGDAEAANEKIIETFTIQENTFVLFTDDPVSEPCVIRNPEQ